MTKEEAIKNRPLMFFAGIVYILYQIVCIVVFVHIIYKYVLHGIQPTNWDLVLILCILSTNYKKKKE